MGGCFSTKRKSPRQSRYQSSSSNSSAYSNSSSSDNSVAESIVEVSHTPVYTLSVTDGQVCIFTPSHDAFFTFQCEDVTEDDVYLVSSASHDRITGFTEPSEDTRQSYIERNTFNYVNVASYRKWILPGLILGCRVRDFEQRCATVSQLFPLVLAMPAQDRGGKNLKLKTILGTEFDVFIDQIVRDSENRRWSVTCLEYEDEELPSEVRQGSQLEILDNGSVQSRQPQVTAALLQFYSPPTETAPAAISNWPLLGAIYGARGTYAFPAIQQANPSIRQRNGTPVQLNPEQADAVARYNSSCPGFVVEAPPGSGKTVTAAAMAVSYRGKGVQLFLSTANVPVINMALALAKLDFGHLIPIHLISAEFEEKCSEETRSPFSARSLAMEDEDMAEEIEEIEYEMAHAPNQERKDELRRELRELLWSILDRPHDIYFATVDTILARYLKQNKSGYAHVDVVKRLLQTKVERIVVDEASQLTESALNALVLCFPTAQIVLIGDSRQLPPFKYKSGDVISQLAARPALDVVQEKDNLEVINLTRVYRASASLIAHYSDVFYEGSLVSHKQEVKSPLSCFGARSKGSRCLFWRVKKGRSKTPQNSTSKINLEELRALKYIVNILRNSKYNAKDVMIISYYEAQRKRAEEDLPGYEVLTVDSAQGREKRIVIVLTTRSSPPAEADEDFFNSPKRCNVAVSRHQEALIVIGHPSIEAAPYWGEVLSKEYFKHVDDEARGR